MKKNTLNLIFGIALCVFGAVAELCVMFRVCEILDTMATLPAALGMCIVGLGSAMGIGMIFIREGVCTFMDMWENRRGNEARN